MITLADKPKKPLSRGFFIPNSNKLNTTFVSPINEKDMENPFETQSAQPRRPAFLTVICILTFIGSGWGVVSGVMKLFTANLMNSNMQIDTYSSMMGDVEDNSLATQMLQSTMETFQTTAIHAKEIATMNLVLSLMSLLGAILMFNQRRLGFYFYAVAQVLMLFVIPYFAGFSMMTVIGTVGSGFITLIFIILYAVNLKHMH